MQVTGLQRFIFRLTYWLLLRPAAALNRTAGELAPLLACLGVSLPDLAFRGSARIQRLAAGWRSRAGLPPPDGRYCLDFPEHERAACRPLLAAMARPPRISIVMPVYKVAPEYFRETLASVGLQFYPHWELCICDDASGSPELDQLMESFRQRFPDQVRITRHQTNQHISTASNAALALATGDYVTLLDHDDRLYPHSLLEVARAIQQHDGPDILYSDERPVWQDGSLMNEFLAKPDWSPLLHLSVNYTTHLSTYKLSLVRGIGGFRKGLEGSQDYDLMLRAVEASGRPVVHIPQCLYQWRTHPQSTSASPDAKPYAAVAARQAVSDHLKRRQIAATVETHALTIHNRITFALAATLPPVHFVVRLRAGDRVPAYIVRLATSYPDAGLTVIAETPVALAAGAVAAQAHPSDSMDGTPLRLRTAGRSGFARTVNDIARAAPDAWLVLLEAGAEPIAPDWLQAMLRLGLQQRIGAVGGILLTPDHTVIHAGLSRTSAATGISTFRGARDDSTEYFGFLHCAREVAAPGPGCALVAAGRLLQAGGLAENLAPGPALWIDLGMRLQKFGLSPIVTPEARFVWHGPPAAAVDCGVSERLKLLRRWRGDLLRDPFHSPVLMPDRFVKKPWMHETRLDREQFQALIRKFWSDG